MDRFLIFEEMYVKTLAELKKRPVSPDESGDAPGSSLSIHAKNQGTQYVP